nr:reverse transcriptase domain-containing protein [Tanacetum cinerariifolium]
MTLELANRAICTPDEIARDVFVPVGRFTFPADFVVVDYESDPRVPLILGRPFLRTARALIDVHGEEMILRDEDERLTLNMKHDTASYSNHPYRESVKLINIFNISSKDCLKDLVSNKDVLFYLRSLVGIRHEESFFATPDILIREEILKAVEENAIRMIGTRIKRETVADNHHPQEPKCPEPVIEKECSYKEFIVIPIGQKNTLAEYMIFSGADNRPPMLDKDLYDSWKSRMETYMQNREQGRMILESVEHGPLIWPTIEENENTLAEYMIFSGVDNRPPMLDKDLYDSCKSRMETYMQNRDQGRMILESVEHGPLIWPTIEENESKFVTDVKLVKELHTTNFDQLHAYLEQYELHANEVRLIRERNQDPLALCPKPKIKRGATWFRDKVLFVKAQGNGEILNEKELEFLANLGITKGPVTQMVITYNTTYQADDLDVYDSDCDDFSTAKAVLMANLSSYASDVLSEVPHSENTNTDMLNQSVHEMSYSEQTHLDTNSSAQQDAMILSVFEQLSNQVTNCNKVNKDNLIANESLFAELERYKER